MMRVWYLCPIFTFGNAILRMGKMPARPAMKKKNDNSLQDAMQDMLQEFRLKPQLDETRVKMLWEQLMGKTIATYTSGIVVRKNVLYLTILSAPLKHELSYAKDRIKNLLNEEMGEDYVKEVVIR